MQKTHLYEGKKNKKTKNKIKQNKKKKTAI